MKSKIPLILMEQMVMLLVFALAAALCLQAFVKSDQMSGRSHDRDRAVTLVQDMAETVRHYGSVEVAARDFFGFTEAEEGTPGQFFYNSDWEPGQPANLVMEYEDGTLSLFYDENWNCGGESYVLKAEEIPSGVRGLGMAKISMQTCNDGKDVLFEVTTAWQNALASQDSAAKREAVQNGT